MGGGAPDRLRVTSGGGGAPQAVMPFGSNTGLVSAAVSGMPFASSSTGMVSGGGGGNLGATPTSRALLAQTGSWGTGLSANSDTGELSTTQALLQSASIIWDQGNAGVQIEGVDHSFLALCVIMCHYSLS